MKVSKHFHPQGHSKNQYFETVQITSGVPLKERIKLWSISSLSKVQGSSTFHQKGVTFQTHKRGVKIP